jgi:hypothetical protein
MRRREHVPPAAPRQARTVMFIVLMTTEVLVLTLLAPPTRGERSCQRDSEPPACVQVIYRLFPGRYDIRDDECFTRTAFVDRAVRMARAVDHPPVGGASASVGGARYVGYSTTRRPGLVRARQQPGPRLTFAWPRPDGGPGILTSGGIPASLLSRRRLPSNGLCRVSQECVTCCGVG